MNNEKCIFQIKKHGAGHTTQKIYFQKIENPRRDSLTAKHLLDQSTCP